ncbi:MAG: transporter [Myxococcota bacterium]|nr:transporter [Myxococcota bacterium]
MLREYRARALGLPDLLNFAALVEEGVVLNKDGALLAGWWYAGPDMESASNEELAILSSHVNAALVRLGNGWMLQADAARRPAGGYAPPGAFPDPTTALIDDERRRQYVAGRSTYESVYALTVTFLPPRDVQARLGGWFVEGETQDRAGYEAVLRFFQRHIVELEDALSDRLSVSRMVSEDLLSFLHLCVTGISQPVSIPAAPMYLDSLLGSQNLVGGFRPRVGRHHIRPIAVVGFPAESFPGTLDFLNRLPVDYRWSNRFIPLDPNTAETRLKLLRRNWFQKRQGLSGLIKQALNMGEPTFGNRDAVAMAEDADDAVEEAASGTVRFGYYTSVILLLDEDPEALEAASRQVCRSLQHHGFAARVEDVNALEAYLGSIPGHGYRNVRRPLVHTLNFADLIPTTSVWPGLEENPCPYYPPSSPALLYANTSGSTPFRLNLHVADVGHTLVLGPTGSGKSTLIGLSMAQFFRYAGAQVFAFDKGYSSFVLTEAAGGDHYDIASSDAEELSFCPLAAVDRPEERLWAAGWIETLLGLQGVTVTPAHRQSVHVALERLGASESRTLTDFLNTVQDREIRDGLRHYTLQGAMGRLLDAEEDGLREGNFQVFEMEHVMNKGDVNAAPVLTYLFHRIEQRLTGRPTLIVIEEAWLMLTHGLFAEKLEEWLRVLRKANAAVVFVTQSLAEVFRSPRRDLLLESCPTRLFLPNPGARSDQTGEALPADRSQPARDRDPLRGHPQAPLLLRLAARSPAHRPRSRSRRSQLRRGLEPRGPSARPGSHRIARQRLARRVAGEPRPAGRGRAMAGPEGEGACLEIAGPV